MADGGKAAQEATTIEKSPLVRFEAVTKRFGSVTAVEALTLDIGHGEFFALLGPSGCGKTTLLRMLAGFEVPTEGRILLDGEDIVRRAAAPAADEYDVPELRTVPASDGRGQYRLRPAPGECRRAEIADRVAEMLALVRLQGFGGRRIDQLSGGQRQRVALARSLIKRPRVLCSTSLWPRSTRNCAPRPSSS